MKKILHHIILFLLLTASVVSCSDDFLDLESPQQEQSTFFTNEENAQLAIIGCYDVMGWCEHNSFPFFFGDIIGRDGHKGGDIGGDQEWMDNLINFTYNSSNFMLDKAWRNYYTGISRCNTAIENISPMSTDAISDETKTLLIAQARFIRGYFYFELVKTFGEVPLVDHVLAPSEYQQPLATIEQLWQFIEGEFQFAGNHLPGISEVGGEWYGRATKGAADAYRAKSYVFQQKWIEAKALTDSIILAGEYDLMPNYEDIFKMENEHNQEIIFSIEFMESGEAEAYGNEVEGNMIGVYLATRNHPYAGIGGWGFDCPTQEFVDQFEDGDPRLDATVITNGETLWAGTSDSATFDTDFPTNIDGYSNQKYVLPASQQPASPYDAGKNWIVIRYADLLLWNAEAAVHTGGDWQGPLQEVRDRIGLGATPYSDPLEAVYHERRVELGMEGHRFWDVVRQGRGEEILGQYGFQEGVHNHFPISQTQQDLSEIW